MRKKSFSKYYFFLTLNGNSKFSRFVFITLTLPQTPRLALH